jgi:hypothetical protein
MRFCPVSTRVNSVVNDGDECAIPVELTQIQNGRSRSLSVSTISRTAATMLCVPFLSAVGCWAFCEAKN